MEVHALIGPSGSGKSHRAQAVAYQTRADVIIDDGLIIHDSLIVDGVSAKRQPTKIGAIKTALFTDLTHRTRAEQTIASLKASRILILGTSIEMIHRITERLGLPLPVHVIKIDQVASVDEIRVANYYRKQLGKHVVPAPTAEVKRTFPNTLIESLQVILHRQDPAKQAVFEQSVVRPTFSYLGKITIADTALEDMIKWVLTKVPGVYQFGKVRVVSDQGNTMVTIEYTAEYGRHVHVVSRAIQEKVKEVIEMYTGLSVLAVDVLATELNV